MTMLDGAQHMLEEVDEEKDLGIIIDCKLSFSSHVHAQVNKANKVLGAIRHTFASLDKETFCLLFKSLVRPHLEYASVVWSPKLKKDRDVLEQVQRRATRMVQGLSHMSYPERLETLKLLTLKHCQQRADIIHSRS
ncbi:uncharacterized protein LOC143039243 [Oratosquilla oratoria]|uniref:uncharacterized protein LOC143039243 n=1 Tax=Oratosquilla oratoria TaxID=337810 RepID=UPI003F75B8ED